MSLNCDSQQFHQYQQNEQSPLILTLNGKKIATTYDVGNQDPGLRHTQKGVGVQNYVDLRSVTFRYRLQTFTLGISYTYGPSDFCLKCHYLMLYLLNSFTVYWHLIIDLLISIKSSLEIIYHSTCHKQLSYVYVDPGLPEIVLCM